MSYASDGFAANPPVSMATAMEPSGSAADEPAAADHDYLSELEAGILVMVLMRAPSGR